MESQARQESPAYPENRDHRAETAYLDYQVRPEKREKLVVVVKIAYPVCVDQKEIADWMVHLAYQVHEGQPVNVDFLESQVWTDYQDLWDRRGHREETVYQDLPGHRDLPEHQLWLPRTC